MKFIIFDLDDTLLCGDCEKYWSDFMVKKGLLSEQNHLEKINKFDEDYRKGVLDFEEYSSYILSPLKGLKEEKIDILLKEFIPESINELSDNLTEYLLNEAKKADTILIASGSLDFLVKGFANHFQIKSFIGTQVEIKNDIVTGRLVGKETFGKGKLSAVKNWCSKNQLKLGDSTFYTDSINDLPLLEACGRPIAVNPDKMLMEVAIKRSYEIIKR